MASVEHLPSLEVARVPPWYRYLLDGALACMSILLVTGGIAVFHLYPRIPNISMLYLLVILGLASTRGRYPAILASMVAFLSFDFFIVPPLYTFVIYRIEE
jgi:two-component system sensor histidine kinase KdpD